MNFEDKLALIIIGFALNNLETLNLEGQIFAMRALIRLHNKDIQEISMLTMLLKHIAKNPDVIRENLQLMEDKYNDVSRDKQDQILKDFLAKLRG